MTGSLKMLAAALVAATSLIPGSLGYMLDSSCSSYESMLRPMLQGAFNLNEAAQKLLKDVEPDAQGKTKYSLPNSAKVKLIGQIFPSALQKGQVIGGNDATWATIKGVFNAVAEIDDKKDGLPSLGVKPKADPADWENLSPKDKIQKRGDWQIYADAKYGPKDVVIYCGVDRLQQNENCDGLPDYLHACDRTIGGEVNIEVVGVSTTDLWEDCNKVGLNAFAYHHGGTTISQITLCKPWLDQLARDTVKTLEDARPWLPNPPDEQVFKLFDDDKLAEIDIPISAGDAVILHELTHAIPSPHKTEDVDGDNSYWWHNVLRIAKTPNAVKNAESYAFFGIGASLISPRQKKGVVALKIMDGGTVEPICRTNRRKRDESQVPDVDCDNADSVPNKFKRQAPNAPAETACVFTPANGPPVTVPGLKPTTVDGKVVCSFTQAPGGPGAPGGDNPGGQHGGDSKSSSSSAGLAYATISSPTTTQTAAITVVPVVSGGKTVSVTYTSSSTSSSKDSQPTPAWVFWKPDDFKPSPNCLVPIFCPDKGGGFPPGITWPPGGGPPPPPPPPPNDPDGDKDKDKSQSQCEKKTSTVCDPTEVVFQPPSTSTWTTTTDASSACRTETACTPTITKTTHTTTRSCSIITTSSCTKITSTITVAGKPTTTVTDSCQTASGCAPTLSSVSAPSGSYPRFTDRPYVHPFNNKWADDKAKIVEIMKTAAPGPAAAASSSVSTTLQTSVISSAPKPPFQCTTDTVDKCSPAVVCHAPQFIACEDGKCVCKTTPPPFHCTPETVDKCSPAVVCHAPERLGCDNGKCVCLSDPPKPSSSSQPPPPAATPLSKPPFVPGICTATIGEEGSQDDGLTALIRVTDGSNNEIARHSPGKYISWGDTITIPKDKLPYDLSVKFENSFLGKRDYIDTRPNPLRYQAYSISITAGDTKWNTEDNHGRNDNDKMPRCDESHHWDSHESWNPFDVLNDLLGLDKKGLPTREVVCKWKC